MFCFDAFGKLRLAGLCLALTLLVTPVHAAFFDKKLSDIELEVDKSGECPVDRVKESLGDRYKNGNGFGYSFYKDDTLKAQSLSKEGGVTLENQPALLEQVRLLARNTGQQTVLVTYSGDRTKRERQFCGWLPWKALVVSKDKPDGSEKSFTDPKFGEGEARSGYGWRPRFLTVGELVLNAPASNLLFAKSLIQTANTDAVAGGQPAITGTSQKNRDYVVKVYDKPGGSAVGDFKMFNVFNIIDTEKRGDEKFFLLAASHDRALGWVREKDQLLWPSRMAVFWAGAGKGIIYPNTYEYYNKGIAFATEPQNVRALLPQDRNVTRFPVLGPSGKNASSSLPDYFEIAFIGLNPDDSERQRVKTTLASLDNIDILFVIDATESMNFLFQDVAQAVRDFAEKIESEDRIQVGVAVYGDYLDLGRGGRFQFETAVALGRPSNRQAGWDDLVKRDTFTDEQKDKPEAVFAAVKKAAQSARWRASAPFRVIIHIGDAGNREAKLPYQVEVMDNPTESEVAGALAAKNISYFPIAVSGAYDRKYNEAFVRQVREIVALNRKTRGSVEGGAFTDEQITYDTETGRDDTRTRQARIGKVLNFIYDEFQRIRLEAEKDLLRTGGEKSRSSAPAEQGGLADNRTLGSWLPTFVKEARKRLNLDTATLDRIYSRPAVSINGFAPTKADGVEVFNYWVALDPDSFHSLRGAMDSLCPKIVQTASDKVIEEAMGEMVRGGSGDRMQEGETFQQFFVRKLYVPTLALNSEFMKHSPQSLVSYLAKSTPKEASEMQQKVCRFAAQLGEMTNDKKTEPQNWVWDNDKMIFQSQNSTKYVWMVKSEFGLPLYYIPLEYLP